MEEEYIYHYTKLEYLSSILKSNSLKTSEFSKANDYKEKYDCLGVNKNDISKYRYVSFEKDDFDFYSYTNPVMWFHYAEKHHGVCLKINKHQFETLCCPVGHFKVKYKDGISYIDRQNGMLEYLMYKRVKWEYESEYRYIYNNDIEYIHDFISCIDSVYFGAETNDDEINDTLNLNSEVLSRYNDRTLNVFKMVVDPQDGGLHGLDYYTTKGIMRG